jgi:hypothetical protein
MSAKWSTIFSQDVSKDVFAFEIIFKKLSHFVYQSKCCKSLANQNSIQFSICLENDSKSQVNFFISSFFIFLILNI